MKQFKRELFIIPCCASKRSGGKLLDNSPDRLQHSISSQTHTDVLSARTQVLRAVLEDPKYTTGKYLKNAYIHAGSDFGQKSSKGKYLTAIERYTGNLYSRAPRFTEIIKKNLDNPSKPKLLILSALYGPLHPLSMIQDYNLQMSDKPAFRLWKSQFPLFLKDYIRRSEIKNIRLYLGGSTAYLKVARAAIQSLKADQLIQQAIQYEVIDGSSFVTPSVHGQLVALHLQGQKNAALEDRVVVKEI